RQVGFGESWEWSLHDARANSLMVRSGDFLRVPSFLRKNGHESIDSLYTLREFALAAQVPAQVVLVVAVGECGFAGYAPGTNELGQGLFHGAHTVGASSFNIGSELVIISAANQISSCGRGHKDLHRRVAAHAIFSRQKLL